MTKATVFLAMALLSIAAFGQTTITVSDGSPTGSPLNFRGTVTWKPKFSADCNITGHNNTSKNILAWTASTNGKKPNGEIYITPAMHDHFWKSDAMISMMAPAGQDFDSGFFCPTFNTGNKNAPDGGSGPASLTITATFVQFTDGTWWGDPAQAKELAWQRNDALTYLQQLSAMDAATLAATIAKEPAYGMERGGPNHLRGEMVTTWKYLSEDPTPAAVVADIAARLKLAKTHGAWLAALQ